LLPPAAGWQPEKVTAFYFYKETMAQNGLTIASGRQSEGRYALEPRPADRMASGLSRCARSYQGYASVAHGSFHVAEALRTSPNKSRDVRTILWHDIHDLP